MTINPKDNYTGKELEESMGFTEAQKSSLLAAGLTKAEIKELHNRRVAEAIAKERERLDRLEAKIRKSLPEYLVEFLEGGEEKKNEGGEGEEIRQFTDEEAEKEYELRKHLLPSEDEGVELPWEGMDDLIFTNRDYWAECFKLVKGDKKLAIPDNIEEMSDEEFERFISEWDENFARKTADIFERRRMGYMKAEYDWIKGHCKGKPPETIATIM